MAELQPNAGLAYYDGDREHYNCICRESSYYSPYGYLKTILQTTGQNIAVNVEQTTVAQVLGAKIVMLLHQ